MKLDEYQRLALHLHIATCQTCRDRAYLLYAKHLKLPAARLRNRLRLERTK